MKGGSARSGPDPADEREAKRSRVAATGAEAEPAAGAATRSSPPLADDPLVQGGGGAQVDHTIINRFKTGFSTWKREMLAKDANFAVNVQKKSPSVLVIACSDMRVNASSICQADPGEIFSVRNVGNMVSCVSNGFLQRAVAFSLSRLSRT